MGYLSTCCCVGVVGRFGVAAAAASSAFVVSFALAASKAGVVAVGACTCELITIMMNPGFASVIKFDGLSRRHLECH